MNVIGEMRSARLVTGVVLSRRLELRGNIRSVPQEPHFLPRANRDRSLFDGDSHGPFELMKCQHEPALPGRGHD